MRTIVMTLSIIGILGLTSCQSFEVEITSVPKGATVEVYNPAISGYEPKGKTPLKIEESELFNYASESSSITSIIVSKPGYAIERLFIDKSGNPKVFMHLKMKTLKKWTGDSELDTVLANSIGSQVQKIYKDIHAKKFEKALVNTEKLVTKYPNAHFFWDIKGSLNYLMGNKSEARTAYGKSMALFPGNTETQRILKSMER